MGVSEAFFGQKRLQKHKFQIIAPEIGSETLNDGDRLKQYFQSLRLMITTEVEVNDLKFRVLIHDEETIPPEQYVIFVPVNTKDEKDRFCILLRFTNLYLAGVLTSDSSCTVFRGKGNGGWGKEGYKKFEECMIMYGVQHTEMVNIEDSYSALQKLAGTTRACLRLGREQLMETFAFLSRSDWSDHCKVSLHLLYTTQFICEPLRIKVFGDWLCENLLANNEKGRYIPLLYLLLQYGWGASSECILRIKNEKKALYVFYDVDDEYPLSVEEIHKYYGILKNFRVDVELSRDPIDRTAMASKYILSFAEFASYGTHYKSSVIGELIRNSDNDYQVKVVKHVFERDIVLEYRYKHTNGGMWEDHLEIIVEYSDDHGNVSEIKNTFVPSFPQNQMFVGVKKPQGVIFAKFKSTLRFIDLEKLVDPSIEIEIVKDKVEMNLKDLYFYGTDYIQKLPKDFMKEWEDIGQNYERQNVYDFKMPSDNSSLSSFINIFKDVFGMHLCQTVVPEAVLVLPEVSPEAVPVLQEVVPEAIPEVISEDDELTACSLSGAYMGKDTVLVKVSINVTETDFITTEAMQMKLTHRCAHSSVGRYIHGTVVNWLQRNFKPCGWKEHCGGYHDLSEEDEPIVLLHEV
ncbi:hypothetical protein POM88_006371 [Heracleum sosnowskyi]|uniref:Coatomer gamma subunit appendage Ig-like subdomain domain-containing protein n=1 Tax=Heracleum sosnowskyi TaxID=360622 RepID=A0AAD8J4R1_9APIA|nr:hypothetical protein POM88_006371 [Heracleum sosnowskyi]